MKKALLLSVVAVSIVSSAFADISVNGLTFNGGSPATLGAVFFDTVGGTPANSTVKANILFGSAANSLTLASSVFTFVSANNGFLNAGTINVTTGALGGGSAGFYQIRAWTGGATFDDAANTKVGSSAVTGLTFGGTPLAGGTAIAPPDLNLHANFAITSVAVPEPATLALGLFGAAGLLFRRRK